MKSSFEKTPRPQQEADELIANISKLMAEAEEMLHDSTSYHAEEKVALLRSPYQNAEHRFMEKYLSAKAKLTSAVKRTDEAIRACPYESLAIALGVGVVLGATLGRRRSE